MKTIKIVIVSLVAFGILLGFSACAWAEQYPRAFLVEELDYENEVVIFSDMAGEQWIWHGTEDWEVDDMAVAIMDDNGTPTTIYDDIIIIIYYQTNIVSWFKPDEVWED